MPPPTEVALQQLRAISVTHDGVPLSVIRKDIAGTVGLHLTMPREHAETIWQMLVARGGEESEFRGRPIGWYALNIARIEAGTPVFNIDFSSSNLPHETSLVEQRINFRKGCYIGQEVVARMHNLGKPKQQLTGLALQSDHLPVAGAAVFENADGKPGDRIGVVTSSTLSPMCSAQPIAFAMLRTPFAEPGTNVMVHAEGEEAHAQSHPLTFWDGEGASV